MGSSIDIMVGAISLIIWWDFKLGLNKAGVQPSWLFYHSKYFDFVIIACTFCKQPNKIKNVSLKLKLFLLVPIYWLVDSIPWNQASSSSLPSKKLIDTLWKTFIFLSRFTMMPFNNACFSFSKNNWRRGMKKFYSWQ